MGGSARLWWFATSQLYLLNTKGALLAGRATARWLLLAPDGSVVSDRMLSKIRGEERGIDYAVRRLRAYGAPPRARGESWSDWTARVVRLPIFRRVRHPGNLAYVFGLDRYAAARLAHLHDGGQPYPRGQPRTPACGAEAPRHRFMGEELAPAA